MFEKDLLRSIAVPVVLRLINQKAMYGYEIIKDVNEKTNGQFQWKEGTLYPCLHRMEGEGLITSEWRQKEGERKRKYYLITRKGKAELKSRLTEWSSFSETVSTLLFPNSLPQH
mgnify:CR=1 FL=1